MTSARIGILCGSHWQRTVPALTSWAFPRPQQDGAGGNFVFLQLAALGIQDLDFAVSGQHDLLARIVADDLQSREARPPVFLARLSLSTRASGHAADMERTHGELGARLADRLGGDDPDGHALFDHRAGGEVHAVAQPADAQGGIASHRAADLNLFDLQFLERRDHGRRDQFVFADHDLVGDRVHDIRPG